MVPKYQQGKPKTKSFELKRVALRITVSQLSLAYL